MYVGHAAIALAIKSRVPDAPIIPLTIACYGPDWLELALMIPRPREGMAIYTHSLPSLFIGAALAAAMYSVISRQPGVMALFFGWLLHWPADFLTGTKPLTSLHTLVGLDLYHLPAVDFVVEAALVVAGCVLYARRFAQSPRQRQVVITLAALLITLQLGLVNQEVAYQSPVLNVGSQTYILEAVDLRLPLGQVERPIGVDDAALGAAQLDDDTSSFCPNSGQQIHDVRGPRSPQCAGVDRTQLRGVEVEREKDDPGRGGTGGERWPKVTFSGSDGLRTQGLILVTGDDGE